MSYQREYSKKLNIAVVGIGSHTYRNLLPALNFLPVTLKAICVKQDMQRAQLTASQYGGCYCYSSTRDMYEREELDAVFICVSPQTHAELVCEALDAGLHVWVEKPPAMSAAEVSEMIAHRRNRVVVVGFKKAFMPAAEKAREVAQSQKYGNLKSVLAVYPMSLPAEGPKAIEERKFTNWLGNGVHPLSFLVSVGGKVSAVTAFTNSEGYGTCILEFKNGVMGTFHLASGPHPVETYSLFGDSWHLTIANTTRVILQRGTPSEYERTTTFAPAGDYSGAVVWEASNCLATLENKALFVQGFFNQMKYFCDCILTGVRSELGSLEFALDVMQVYEAALISQGKTVRL